MKPKVPDSALGGRVEYLPALWDLLMGGLETKSAGWDTGKLLYIPDVLKNMPISLDKSLNLPMP